MYFWTSSITDVRYWDIITINLDACLFVAHSSASATYMSKRVGIVCVLRMAYAKLVERLPSGPNLFLPPGCKIKS